MAEEVKQGLPDEVNETLAALGKKYPQMIFIALESKLSKEDFIKRAPALQVAINKALQ